MDTYETVSDVLVFSLIDRQLYWTYLWQLTNLTETVQYNQQISDHEYGYYSLEKLHYRMNITRLDAYIS